MGIMIGIFALLFIAMGLVVKYCKKKLKIILAGVIILAICYSLMLSIDMNRVNSFREPVFAWDIKCKCANMEKQYQGLGYKIEIKYFEDGEMEKVTMAMFGKVIAAAIADSCEDQCSVK